MISRAIKDYSNVDVHKVDGMLSWTWLINDVKVDSSIEQEAQPSSVMIDNDEKRKEMVSLFDSEKKKVVDVDDQIDKSRGSQATTRYVIMMNACEIIVIC